MESSILARDFRLVEMMASPQNNFYGDDQAIGSMPTTSRIETENIFSFMELPAELRLKIYRNLLVCSAPISIPFSESPADKAPSYPSVAILGTCKLINEEATPILYSNNDFLICLPLERRRHTKSGDISSLREHSFQLSHLRWSTLAYMKSMNFTSGNSTTLPDLSFSSSSSRPTFSCSGQDIISRFSNHDFRYSPQGPDEYMALSVSNWVSTKVMRAELSAFQKELEAMMRSVPNVVAAAAAGTFPGALLGGAGAAEDGAEEGDVTDN
ncbi:hypothetical protein G7Y89_g9590 [Cudoniella acicularis]|uniref:F-box domain-containing protein n=1 Tax=Cudoniella acicularis TaxID=354080 RepID=A0A8H4RGK8_9HELO|nr:hypothetical protein G7Y89_g9590 [Cudoniella acicularis]